MRALALSPEGTRRRAHRAGLRCIGRPTRMRARQRRRCACRSLAGCAARAGDLRALRCVYDVVAVVEVVALAAKRGHMPLVVSRRRDPRRDSLSACLERAPSRRVARIQPDFGPTPLWDIVACASDLYFGRMWAALRVDHLPQSSGSQARSLPRPSRGLQCLPGSSKAVQGIVRYSKVIPSRPRACKGLQGLPGACKVSPRLPGASQVSQGVRHGLPQASRGGQVVPLSDQAFQGPPTASKDCSGLLQGLPES